MSYADADPYIALQIERASWDADVLRAAGRTFLLMAKDEHFDGTSHFTELVRTDLDNYGLADVDKEEIDELFIRAMQNFYEGVERG